MSKDSARLYYVLAIPLGRTVDDAKVVSTVMRVFSEAKDYAEKNPGWSVDVAEAYTESLYRR